MRQDAIYHQTHPGLSATPRKRGCGTDLRWRHRPMVAEFVCVSGSSPSGHDTSCSYGRSSIAGSLIPFHLLTLTLLTLFFLSPSLLFSQTIYAVVLGNQKYVVGSSTLHSGLFRSIDTGRTWEQLGPRNLKAYSMDAVDSSRGRILYIAAGNGVHRSTDFGKTWKITTDWRMTEVMDVKVDQNDPQWVYAATAWGFWRSSDGGETWENPEGHLQSEYVYRIQPTTPGSYAEKYLYYHHEMQQLTIKRYITGHARYFYMTDTILVKPLLSSNDYVSGKHRSGIENIDNLKQQNQHGIFPSLSVDLRATSFGPVTDDQIWMTRGDGAIDLGNSPRMSTYDAIFSSHWVADSEVYAAGTNGVWSARWLLPTRELIKENSKKGKHNIGATLVWEDISSGLPTLVTHAIVKVHGTLLAGTWGHGIYRREGETWVASGLEGSQVWSITVKEY